MRNDPALGQPTDAPAHASCVPSSSAAAGSLALVRLPELPRFAGPTNHVVGAARFSAPLLVLGAYYTLAIHGLLSVPSLVLAGSVGLVGMLSAHATLLARRRKLLGAARALRDYAERSVGRDHELYRRASQAVHQLERDTLISDPSLATDVEQGIGYTRELLLGVRSVPGRSVPERSVGGRSGGRAQGDEAQRSGEAAARRAARGAWSL